MTINEIKAEIKSLSGNNADFYNKLNPTGKPSLGVRLPDLRNIAKRIAREDYEWFLQNNPMDTFEEETLEAFVIGYAKDDIQKILGYLKDFIPKVHDWSVNDSLCSTFKIARKYPEETLSALEPFYTSHREFEVRGVAIMLMCHFLRDEYVDRVIAIWNKLDLSTGYYARMGVAWAIATLAAKYPQKCFEYMTGDNNLDEWTFNKTLQKMKESYRVDNELVERIQKRLINKN